MFPHLIEIFVTCTNCKTNLCTQKQTLHCGTEPESANVLNTECYTLTLPDLCLGMPVSCNTFGVETSRQTIVS